MIKEKKYKKALALLTKVLTRDRVFEMGYRVRLVTLLVEIFGHMKIDLTPGALDLKRRFLEPQPQKKYLIALDYSASMRVGNKIDNTVKAVLEIWDNYVLPRDKVCYVRFNMNTDVIFDLEPKKINTFAKRVEIEKSGYPKDRTCFFDCLHRCCEIFSKDNRDKTPSKNYLIIFCDGDDTSSLKQQREVLELVQGSDICVIAVGLGLRLDTTTREMMVSVANASSRNGGVYLDIHEDSFEDLFQVISDYANNRPFSELHWE